MKLIRRFLLALAFLCAAPVAALASQGSGCVPIVGPITPTAFAADINSALAAIISSNSGGSAPATDCSGAPVVGQPWWDTTTTTPFLRYWDGVQGLPVASFDLTNHITMPVQGGGVATVTAASTVDLCAVPQDHITISGSTPITSFGTSCQAGQWKYLSFTGPTPLTYNSTSILTVNGQSLTTANGTQATAEYLGSGIWQIRDFQTPGGAFQPGQITYTAGSTADPGFLLCTGTASRTTFAALFARIGTTYGAGDGSTTFGLPDVNGRAIIGVDHASTGRVTAAGGNFDATQLGASGGLQGSVVQKTNLGTFNMSGTGTGTASDPNGGAIWTSNGGSQSPNNGFSGLRTSGSLNVSTTDTIASGGGNVPLPTEPPAIAINCEIKY